MSSALTPAARKVLRRWTIDDYYVYLHPTASIREDGDKLTLYWNVSVEFRFVEWKQWRGEGFDLSAVIMEMNEKIPRRKKMQPEYRNKKVRSG